MIQSSSPPPQLLSPDLLCSWRSRSGMTWIPHPINSSLAFFQPITFHRRISESTNTTWVPRVRRYEKYGASSIVDADRGPDWFLLRKSTPSVACTYNPLHVLYPYSPITPEGRGKSKLFCLQNRGTTATTATTATTTTTNTAKCNWVYHITPSRRPLAHLYIPHASHVLLVQYIQELRSTATQVQLLSFPTTCFRSFSRKPIHQLDQLHTNQRHTHTLTSTPTCTCTHIWCHVSPRIPYFVL